MLMPVTLALLLATVSPTAAADSTITGRITAIQEAPLDVHRERGRGAAAAHGGDHEPRILARVAAGVRSAAAISEL